MEKQPHKATFIARISLSEDWLAICIAAIVILFSVLGILGPHGIPIRF